MALLFAALCSLGAQESQVPDDSVLLLSYFRTPDEALHLAHSQDGLKWTALNENKPIFRVAVGNKSVRDPFIRKGLDGWFHFISTNSWKAKDLIYAKSKDLVHWEGERLLPVMETVPGTRNVWAPEFVYDEAKEEYLIFWSSVTEPEGKHQRTWCCRTKDFTTVSAPTVLFDPGFTQIDATIVRDKDTCFLIFKDERGANKKGTDNKAMRVATASALGGPYSASGGLVCAHLTEGPAVFQAGGRWLMLYDHFMEHKWGASESQDLKQWQSISDQVIVPDKCRHGSVFTVTRKEFEQLQEDLNK